MAESRPTIIGLAGGTGSGKTTITEALLKRLGSEAVLLQHDWYYRDQTGVSAAARAAVNYDHPEAQETALLIEHVKRLRSGVAVEAPQYDFATHTRRGTTCPIPPRAYIVVEGINTLAAPGLRALCDLTVFVDTPSDVRFARRLQRDVAERGRSVESVVEQYLGHVRPMHEAFVAPCKAVADLVLSGEAAVEASVDAIFARLGMERAVQPRLLLLSNSTMAGEDYLGWARPHIEAALGGVDEALFIPYAAVDISFDDYTARVREGMGDAGSTVTGIHALEDKCAALTHARAVIVGGGNTFSLLAACQREGLMAPLRAAVRRGALYAGWSAGANLACPTIKTTNDMPIESTAGLEALGLIDFQINPHYTLETLGGHGGESRDQRLREYARKNPAVPVLGLPEGMWVAVERGSTILQGKGAAVWYRGAGEPEPVVPGILLPGT